jgi:hypothetical protein
MRNVVLAILLMTVLLAGTASAAGLFGPPEPLADPGKFSLDAGYTLDKTRMTQGDDRLGTRSNDYYLQGNYSFLKDWEVYGRAGAADMVVHSTDTQQRFGTSPNFFGSLGVKGVAYRCGNFAFGPFVEGSMYSNYSGIARNQWESDFGVSAQYKIKDVIVYGGPFGYFRQADSQLGLNPPISQDDMKERSNIGGFLGLRFPIVQQTLFLTAEAQMRDRPGVGAALSYKF